MKSPRTRPVSSKFSAASSCSEEEEVAVVNISSKYSWRILNTPKFNTNQERIIDSARKSGKSKTGEENQEEDEEVEDRIGTYRTGSGGFDQRAALHDVSKMKAVQRFRFSSFLCM